MRVLKYLIVMALCYGVSYLFLSFVEYNMNFAEWHPITRAIGFVMGFFWTESAMKQ